MEAGTGNYLEGVGKIDEVYRRIIIKYALIVFVLLTLFSTLISLYQNNGEDVSVTVAGHSVETGKFLFFDLPAQHTLRVAYSPRLYADIHVTPKVYSEINDGDVITIFMRKGIGEGGFTGKSTYSSDDIKNWEPAVQP